jgi:hypothetical protein
LAFSNEKEEKKRRKGRKIIMDAEGLNDDKDFFLLLSISADEINGFDN